MNMDPFFELTKNVLLFLRRRVKGIVTFTYPAIVASINLQWRSKNTTNFTGKVCFKILNDRSSTIKIFCDKSAVRNYVETRIGKEYLPKLFWEGTTLLVDDLINLPNEFVVKPSHSSGGSVIVSNQCNSKLVLPLAPYFSEWRTYAIHPSSINQIHLTRLANYWTQRSFYNFPGKLPEWGYKNIFARILIEECLLDRDHRLPDDYKFFMFQGRCKLVYKYSGRFAQPSIDLFDCDWNRIEGSYLLPNSTGNIPKPNSLKEMIEISECLAKDIDFVRVDLYDTNQGVKFGEMTNYPMSGLRKFKPEELNKWISHSWAV